MLSRAPLSTLADRYRVDDLVRGLLEGEPSAWVILGSIAALIAFFYLYKRITGRDFVKSKAERREARRRRQHVLWEYKRDE